MSLWNFLGGFALFNLVCDWLSSPPKAKTMLHKQDEDFYDPANRYDRLNDLEDRLDELESQLDDCDIYSDQYDSIQDEIDRIQDCIDEIYDEDL